MSHKSNPSSDNWSSTKDVLWTYWCQIRYIYYHAFNAVKKIVFLLLRTNDNKSPCSNIIIIIIHSLELFPSAVSDGLSLESEWQQVSSSFQDSS